MIKVFKNMFILLIVFLHLIGNSLFAASQTVTYNGGDIPTAENNWPGDNGSCTAAVLTVNIPLASNEAANITGVDVSYDMTAQNNGWKSDQNSQIYYVEGNADEGGYTQGSGNSEGTQSYTRTGLMLANGISTTGVLHFEMHDYRTWSSSGHSGCDDYNNKVDDDTWTITVHYNILIDTDYDGILDINDIDDDNDGILDMDEWYVQNTGLTGQWTDEGNFLASGDIGNNHIEFQSLAGNGSTGWTYTPNDPINSNNGADLWSNPDVDGSNALQVDFENASVGETRTLTVNFSIPQTRVVAHFDRLGGSDGSNANSIELTLTDANVSLNRVSGNTQFIADSGSKKIYRDTTNNLTSGESDNGSQYAAGGSVAFVSATPFTTLHFDVAWLGPDGTDEFEVIFDANYTTPGDSDGDGLTDDLDLDSDNDGIPDNVEAQSTENYVTPTGNVDANGLDTAYNGSGLVLIDTDGDNIPDVVDSDSDGDDYTDCEEGTHNSVTNKTCPVDNTDVGTNGLVSWAETADDYSDTNGIVNTPLQDLQTTGNTPTEADYRIFADNDGDGVSDLNDIDDDNDGILDSQESPCLQNNGSIEEPVISSSWELFNETDVPYWYTSASDDKIEIWNGAAMGVPPYEGEQFSEINANEPASLYQDFNTTAGEILHWTVAHRGRDGVDVATVTIGAPGSLQISTSMSDGNTAWGVYNGTYRVPVGQSVTRISFDSVSESGGRDSYGNFIDGFCVRIDRYDSDGDGIYDYLDLDSDNDGIPDNVEAQPTGSYDIPAGVWSDADGDGLADQYDDNDSGVEGSHGLIPPDTDGDGIADFLDTDTDNDGYTDCEEGMPGSVPCPVDSTKVGINGLIEWAENSDIYWNGSAAVSNGKVSDPLLDLVDEVTSNGEAAYREFLCGKALTTLTKRNWKLISVPCKTGNIRVEDLFQGVLGSYGEPSSGGHWVMYQQAALVENSAGDDNFEISATHTNTNKTKLTADSSLLQGVGYWIIWDDGQGTEEINITIDKTLQGLEPSARDDASSLNDPDFDKAFYRDLPDNDVEDATNTLYKKFIAGNPYPYAFDVKNLYFTHGGGSNPYHPMGDSSNDTYINPTFYKHDSPLLGPVTGYEAINPGTPGFGNGGIRAMEGFFIKIEKIDGETASNGFAYPLMMRNGNGN